MFNVDKIKWLSICDLRGCGDLSMGHVNQALAKKGADRGSVTHFYVTQKQLNGIVTPEDQENSAHDERGSFFSVNAFFGRTVRVMPENIQMISCETAGEGE